MKGTLFMYKNNARSGQRGEPTARGNYRRPADGQVVLPRMTANNQQLVEAESIENIFQIDEPHRAATSGLAYGPFPLVDRAVVESQGQPGFLMMNPIRLGKVYTPRKICGHKRKLHTPVMGSSPIMGALRCSCG